MKWKIKLRSTRGETLIESLTAMLIVVLSSLLLLHITMVTKNINEKAEKADKSYQTELSSAEAGNGSIKGQVTLHGKGGETQYDVIYTGGKDQLTSYTYMGDE